jgi:hypothetical protein
MINNTTVVNSLYGRSISGTSTLPFVDIFMNRDPTPQDVQYVVQQKWLNTLTDSLWILKNFSSTGGYVSAQWFKIGGPMSFISTLTGNSGGPVAGAPVTNNVNIVGDGTTIDVVGTPGTNTLTITGLGVTNTTYTANVGTATPLANNLNVFGASGISTTASGDTVLIETTGTVATSFVADTGTAVPFSNAILINGVNGLSTSASGNQIKISGIDLFSSVNVQTFTTSGTYTPTVGMLYCQIEVIGAGGGGGGCYTNSGVTISGGGGGGGGGYARGNFTAAAIGATQVVTVGAAGTAGAANSPAPGGTGGTSSVGALISATGGIGGFPGSNGGTQNSVPGSAGGLGIGGNFQTHGSPGGSSLVSVFQAV